MGVLWLQIIFLALLGLSGCLFIAQQQKRSALDVIDDLTEGDSSSPNMKNRLNLSDELGSAGIIDENNKLQFRKRQRAMPFIFAFILGIASLLMTEPSIRNTFLFSLIGLCVGYIFSKSMLRRAKAKYSADLVFFLPIVMERIVMAVQAGLDIIPALKTVSELDEKTRNKTELFESLEKQDPVTQLLGLVVKLTDAGISFEQSLNDVAGMVESSPLKHAFIHLGVAQREGGELIMPLKELSDSTQLYFQESVEEDIAKMPVKATMPLLCTFAGLIICFITTPLIQVVELTANTTIPNF